MKRAAENSNKGQTEILIGIALLVLAALFACFALLMPKVGSPVITDVETTAAAPSFNAEGETVLIEDAENAGESGSASFPLNLNTCTAEELVEIKGIGEARANAILAYRDYLGGYSSVDQIKDISGIGDSLFEEIAPYLTV